MKTGLVKAKRPPDHEHLFPNAIVRAVLWRAGYACERCGGDGAVGLYARKLPAKSGMGVDQRACNLVVLDAPCFRWLWAKRSRAFACGYAVVPEADAGGVVLNVYGLGLRLLTVTGEYRVPLTQMIDFRKRSA
jgi:hypothetical protein